jgi:cell volume regulation protein A
VQEPLASALLFTTFAALVVVGVFFSRAFERFGVPVALLFLGIGMLAGSDGVGGIAFANYGFAFRLGTAALVLILFDGGLNTPIESVRRVWKPAAMLATVGVVAVAAITALGANLLGFQWPQAMLLGAIVSSTDAAAVFVALRNSGIGLRRKVGSTLEVESGLNDPMAVILTIGLTSALVRGEELNVSYVLLKVVRELAIGGVVGFLLGRVASKTLPWLRLRSLGLYPVVTLGFGMLSFGLATLLTGSGFLAVFITGVVLGNGPIPYRAGVFRTIDAMAWLSQVLMFLVFGLLVFPRQLPAVAMIGLLLAFVLVFIARPAAAIACLTPFGFSVKESAYIGWMGLRGAVPIVLAIYPVLANAPGANQIFNVVFFIVAINAILPGSTVAGATRFFGMEVDEPPKPHALLELESMTPLRGEMMTFYVDEALAVANAPLGDLPFPDGAAAALIIRGDEMIPPKGSTILLPGDHIYVFAKPEDKHFMLLMFGRPEEE